MSEKAENYEPSVRERLRVAAEYIQIGFLMLLTLTFFIYPLSILRGNATRPHEAIVGILGLLCWAYGATLLAQHWPI